MKKKLFIYFAIIVVCLCKSLNAVQTTAIKKKKTQTISFVDHLFADSANGSLTEEQLKKYLAQGVNINAQYKDGSTALVIAVRSGHYNIVKLLLDNHADIEKADTKDNTPLIWAINKNAFEIVKLLLENHAKVNEKNRNGVTPLIQAAFRNNIAIVQLLLDYHADINAQDNTGASSLFYTFSNGNLAIAQWLIDHHANMNLKDTNGNTVLVLAVFNNAADMVRLLLTAGADATLQNKAGDTVLGYIKEDSDMAKIFAEYKLAPAGLAILPNKMLFEALDDSLNEKRLHEFIAQGVDINVQNKDGFTALNIAAREGYDAIVKLLLDNHADVEKADTNGDTPLIWAISQNHFAIVKWLLHYHADINLISKRGDTPLTIAVYTNKADIVRLLLAAGADPLLRDNAGNTALSYIKKDSDIAKIFVEYNLASAEFTNLLNKMILEIHAGTLTEKKLHEYFAQGVNINAQDSEGSTLLMWAAHYNKPKIVRVLLQANADVTIHNKSGQTVFDYIKPDSSISEIFAEHDFELAQVALQDNKQKEAYDHYLAAYNRSNKNSRIHAHAALQLGLLYKTQNLQQAQKYLNEAVKFGEKFPDIQKEAEIALEEVATTIAKTLAAQTEQEAIKALNTYRRTPVKGNLKTLNKALLALEKLNNPACENTIREINEAIQAAARSATPQEGKKTSTSETQQLETKRLLKEIEDKLQLYDMSGAKRLLQDLATFNIVDQKLKEQYEGLTDQWKKQQADLLRTGFEKALNTYKQSLSLAHLKDAKDVLQELENLQVRQLKKYISDSCLQLRSLEKENKVVSVVVKEEVKRVSPVSVEPEPKPYLIFDPYQTLAGVPTAYQPAIHAALEKLSDNFENSSAEKLEDFEGLWRIRTADYRIVYTLLPQQHAIGIINIEPRKSVYKKENLMDTREIDFRALNTYTPDELLSHAEKLLKTNRDEDAGRAVALLELYRSLEGNKPHEVGNYLKSLLYSAKAYVKLQNFPQAHKLLTNLTTQAAGHPIIQQHAQAGLAQLENVQLTSPTPDNTTRRLRKLFQDAQRFVDVDPVQSERKLEAFLKETDNLEELAAERKEATQLLRHIDEFKQCEFIFETAVGNFKAGKHANALTLFNQYQTTCGSFITPERKELLADYIAKSQPRQAILQSMR